MANDAQATLFHPFESGRLDAPAGPLLFLGARPGFRLPAGFAPPIIVQGFRPDYLALKRAGHDVIPEPAGDGFAMALVVAGRHRGENEARLAEAVTRVSPGGLVVMAGGKTDGIASLRKRLAGIVAIDGHLAKNHGEVFWLTAGTPAKPGFLSPFGRGGEREPGEGQGPATIRPERSGEMARFHAAAGMFSHDRIDPGSRLLAHHLPATLKGRAADFCAGWGYLSVALAERAPDLASIDLFEADHASLEAAGRNMAALAPNMPAAFHWLDLVTEKVARDFDVIVMNPPFHQGRAADPGIGEAMIRAASGALKPGGQLFMVANRGLPYPPALKSGFAQVAELADESGFKVWRARR